MQTVIRGVSQLKVTRSRMAPGSSAGTGGRWTSRLPVEAVQPPYHLFRRGIEVGLLPYAAAHHIGVLAYGPLARGLLSGTIAEATTFGPGDWRSHSPAFTGPGFGRNLDVVAAPPSPSSRRPGCWPTGRPGRDRRRAPHIICRKAPEPSIWRRAGTTWPKSTAPWPPRCRSAAPLRKA
jgi:aryl-alcohol dehydrogenase-like predicted oxidoreductase